MPAQRKVPATVPVPEVPYAVKTLRDVAGILEERGRSRDTAAGERSMAATVAAFNAIFSKAVAEQNGCLTETQGWQFMQLLKMRRSSYGVYNQDDYDDAVGYAALAAESEAHGNGL